MTVTSGLRETGRKIVEPIARSLYDLAYAINETGLAPGHRDYVRFVILASSRTGSTLVTRALNKHDKVVTYGEIMRQYDRPPAAIKQGNSKRMYQTDPARFLEKRIYRKYPKEINAVGFKIFYYHASRDTEWGQAIWSCLAKQERLRVIHLRRRNLLAAQLSAQKAAMTREWTNYSGASMGAVTLDYEETRERFEALDALASECEEILAGHQFLDLFYEDVAEDFSAEMNRVQTFLDLPPRELAPTTKKRPSQPLAQQIANYHDLKDQFAGSAWARFFDE